MVFHLRLLWINRIFKTTHELVGSNLSKLGEDLLKFPLRQILAKVLHIYICELLHLRHLLSMLCLVVTNI